MIKTFAQAEERLATVLDSYESRPQQTALAEGVEDALATRTHLLAEAGCGVGKSFGALIPAVQWSAANSKRVVYSTATKALQDQIAGKDVPFLQDNLGVDFTWALLKGRSNYLCQAAMAQVDEPFLASVRAELDDDHDGDVESLSTPLTEAQRRQVTTTSDDCPGRKECPFGPTCFAEKAKAQAAEANLVIVNHALLFTDLVIREKTAHYARPVSMLGDYDSVIIDEAHEVEEWATNAIGDQLRLSAINKLVKEITNFGADQKQDVAAAPAQKLRLAAEAMFAVVPDGDAVALTTSFFADHEDEFTAVIRAARELAEKIPNVDSDKAVARRGVLEARTERLADRVTTLFLSANSEMVRWSETEIFKGKPVKSLNAAPLNVSDWLTTWLWSRVPSVLMSATLSVGGDFSYLQSRIGLRNARTVNVGTPFSYMDQSLLYIPPTGTPDPKSNREGWLAVANAITMELVDAAGGGALLLFTSTAAMNTAHRNLSARLASRGHTVLLQGVGTNRALGAQFKADNNSVLFALKSFMTGVDFQGDTCRLVIIDKLPFPVPTDIMFAARCADVDARAGRRVSFQRLSIPAMTLTLHQAFGRLIRSKTDRGVVAILDSRLVSTGYGRTITGNLPDCDVTHTVSDVERFFAA